MQNKGFLVKVLLITFIILTVLAYSTNVFSEKNSYVLQNIVFLTAAGFATFMGFLAVKKNNVKTNRGKAILFITLGVGMWFLGELSWVILEISGIDAFPSIADFFYLIAYPFFFVGVLKEFKVEKVHLKTKKFFFTVLAMVGLTALTAYFTIYTNYDITIPLIENIISLSYGVGDIILLVIAAILIINYKGELFSDPWVVFATAMFLSWLGDIEYAIYYEPYEAGIHLFRQMDYFWIISYLLISYFFYELLKKNLQKQPQIVKNY
ncbi:hypothetical protein GOV04_03365 [Candidatus Woesearchaeota archaeon]|nr:hypothetical protein [Candidatus Woesearchaeota archaeon]